MKTIKNQQLKRKSVYWYTALMFIVVGTLVTRADDPMFLTGNDTHGPVSADDYPKTTAGGPPSTTTYKNLKWRTKKCAPCTKNEQNVWQPAPCDCVQGFKYDEGSQTGIQNNNWGTLTMGVDASYGLKADGSVDVSLLKGGLMKALGLGSGSLTASAQSHTDIHGNISFTITWSWQSDIAWTPANPWGW